MADVRADGAPPGVKTMGSDNGCELYSGEFASVCKQFRIQPKVTKPKRPDYNGVAERGLGTIDKAAHARRIQARIIYSNV